MSASIARKVVQSFRSSPGPADETTELSQREREVLNGLAETSEEELDSGRWTKSVPNSGKPTTCVFSIPNLLKPPDRAEWIRRGVEAQPGIQGSTQTPRTDDNLVLCQIQLSPRRWSRSICQGVSHHVPLRKAWGAYRKTRQFPTHKHNEPLVPRGGLHRISADRTGSCPVAGTGK